MEIGKDKMDDRVIDKMDIGDDRVDDNEVREDKMDDRVIDVKIVYKKVDNNDIEKQKVDGRVIDKMGIDVLIATFKDYITNLIQRQKQR